MGEHLWAGNTRVVGQITPRAAQGLKLESGGDGLETAIMYMKQEVDDAQRIAQMMAVRTLPHQSSQRGTEPSCWCSTQVTSGCSPHVHGAGGG